MPLPDLPVSIESCRSVRTENLGRLGFVEAGARASGEEPGRGDDPVARAPASQHPPAFLSCSAVTLGGFVLSSVEVAVIDQKQSMDIRALPRQGYTYAEIGRMLGRDWRTVKQYLEEGAQPAYRPKRMPSKLDPVQAADRPMARDRA